MTFRNYLSPEPPSVDARFLGDRENLNTVSVINIFCFILQFLLCNRLFILWPLQSKLFHRRLRSAKSYPDPPQTMGLVTMRREDGFDALPACVLTFGFHLNIVHFGETSIVCILPLQPGLVSLTLLVLPQIVLFLVLALLLIPFSPFPSSASSSPNIGVRREISRTFCRFCRCVVVAENT